MAKSLAKSKKIKEKDSDGDGLSDFDEINYFGSDPNDADTDGDGVDDGEAVLNGRHPVTGQKLKDFFIPHAGNNYKPAALRPKRLLFHAIGILGVKAVIMLLVFFYPLSAWMTPDISAIEGKKIIALTNTLRQGLALGALTENSKLDSAATKKVEDMFINQYFAHLSPNGLDLEYFLRLASYKSYIMVGENLAMGFDNAEEVMTAWEKSPTHYSNLIDPNFKEIGVALASGAYKDKDTVFIAQYFGLSQLGEAPITPKTEIKKSVNEDFKAGEKAVLAVRDAKVTIDKPAGAKKDAVVKVEATLPVETKTATLEILNNNITMAPVAQIATSTVVATETKWVGQAVIQEETKSITPPVISLGTENGEVQKVEVSNNNIEPQKTSIADQYLLFKTHPTKGLNDIFNISSLYFKLLLGFVTFAMLLNVFIQIKKQHPKLIFSGLGIITLLIFLIIF